MTQRIRRLLLEFAFAIAVCGAIAYFDRILIGVVGAVVCTVIYAARIFLSRPFRSDTEELASELPGTVLRERESIVYGHAPHCYRPGNPIYYPPDTRDFPQGD